MIHIIFRRWTGLLLLISVLMVSLACLFVTGSSSTGSPTVDGSSTESQTEGEIIIKGDVVYGPGSFNYAQPAAGLSDLSSYKAILTLSFNGTEAGQTSQWSRTYVMLTDKDAAVRQLTMEKSGQVSDPEAEYMAEADGAAYERLGENACNANVIDPENSLGERLEPAGFLTGVFGAEEAGSETMNGITANHYTFDERALGQLEIAKSTGEIWVASDGGYLVKYVLTTTGTSDFFGEGIEGTLTWDYELTDVNQPVSIELPADCPAGMVNVPKLPDASNVVDEPGMLMYDTSSSLADAAAFYQEQLPDFGWELFGEPTITETIVLMDLIQGDQNLSVIITVGDAVSRVQILLENSEK